MLASIAFFLFSLVLIGAALAVIVARNPVHSVLFLILAFFNAAGLFVLMGAEFIAMIVLIVYIGAVAVLFLFVVMMLDIDFAAFKKGALQYLPVGGFVGLVLMLEIGVVVFNWAWGPAGTAPMPAGELTNTEAIGRVLYTDYIHLFQVAGLILLVAMIGAIVLTLRHREGVRRQSIAAQVARDPKEAVALVDIKPGKGA